MNKARLVAPLTPACRVGPTLLMPRCFSKSSGRSGTSGRDGNTHDTSDAPTRTWGAGLLVTVGTLRVAPARKNFGQLSTAASSSDLTFVPGLAFALSSVRLDRFPSGPCGEAGKNPELDPRLCSVLASFLFRTVSQPRTRNERRSCGTSVRKSDKYTLLPSLDRCLAECGATVCTAQ